MSAPISISYDEIASYCERNRIRKLALFGSALRDDFGPESDLDVLVEFEPDAVIGLKFIHIQDELSELFGHQVDLNTPGFLSDHFRQQVLESAKVLYERQG